MAPSRVSAIITTSILSLIYLVSAQSTVALGPTGACPVLPKATVEAQPVVYSQYLAQNTSIAPFNNGFTYIIANAPTTFSVSTTVYITNCGSSAPTTSAPSTATPLRLGEGLPSGKVSSVGTDTPFVLGWVGLNLPTRRDLGDLKQRAGPDQGELYRRDPAQTVSNIQNAASAAQTGGAGNWISGNNAAPVKCNSATAYSLVNGQLLQGNTPIGKYQGDTTLAFGAALNGNANLIINVGFSLINGLLAWQPPDVGLAVFYSCGGVLYAVFDPTKIGLAVAPYGNCSLVAIGGLSSTSCSASVGVLPIASVTIPSLTIPSITIPSPSSINPTGFLSIQTPRISSTGISGILAGLSSITIPSKLPSLSIGSISINTARPSLSSFSLAIPSVTIPSIIKLAPPPISSIVIPWQPPSLSSFAVPSQPPSLSSLNLAPPSLSSFMIPSQPPSLSTINLAPPSLSSFVIPSQPPSLSSLSLALPFITIPSTVNLAPPAITVPSLSIGSLSFQTPVLSPPSISIPSLSIGSLSVPSFSPPSISIPTAIIRGAYNFIRLNFSRHDYEIILIGFSRGAFTARAAAQLITDLGLLSKQAFKYLVPVYDRWKHSNDWRRPAGITFDDWVARLTNEGLLRTNIFIKICAVWDTVGSLGFPMPGPIPQRASKRLAFVNSDYSSSVEISIQALALNERRKHFMATIWKRPPPPMVLKPCRFLGAHSDVVVGTKTVGWPI